MSNKLTNRLGECLKEKGIKKSQLAYYLGLDRASVTRLERGDIRPSIETALRLAAFFKTPVEEIFQLVEDDNKPNFPASLGSVGETNNNAETMKG
jgi:putative transcriptional regulator